MKQTAACPSCGAKLVAGAERCDLCGTSVADPDEMEGPEVIEPEVTEPEVTEEEHIVAEPAGVDHTATSIEPVPCAICEHVNPARSRFCNQCGTFLSNAPPASSASDAPRVPNQPTGPEVIHADVDAERLSSDVGLRALGMVGLGIAAVVILYGLTVYSNRDRTPAAPPEAPPSAATLSDSAELPDSLRTMAGALEAEGTVSGWTQLGHLYFTAAMQSGDETVRAELAGRAVDAFDLSLGIEENPDVRSSLAEAAQFDPRNPMRAVLELRTVLDIAPDHVAANYLLGTLRSRIGRLDGAAESFQRVIDLTPEDDPIHQRAAEDLAAVRQTMASAPSAQ